MIGSDAGHGSGPGPDRGHVMRTVRGPRGKVGRATEPGQSDQAGGYRVHCDWRNLKITLLGRKILCEILPGGYTATRIYVNTCTLRLLI